MKLPAVAVIMTLYVKDRLDHFELAVASLERQVTQRAIHIYLCCDGALSQEQEAWLDLNANRFFKVLRNPKNVGLAGSLNRLIDVLEDEQYVFRMDGDDLSRPSRFETQIALMEVDQTLALVGAQALDIDESGGALGQRAYPTDPARVRAALGRMTPVLHPSFCIRRSILRDPKVRYPDAYLCEDLAFLIVIAETGGRLANSSETLLQWRVGAGFYQRRRNLKRGLVEVRWYMRGLKLNGRCFSLQAIYPLLRLVLRLLPVRLVERLYRSNVRNRILGKV